MGAGNRAAIGTLVERHTAPAIRDGICSAMADPPPLLGRSVAWDQGREMALHAQVTATLGTANYFCDAHCPWQRGPNENTDGLLRDYFPKGTDLGPVTPDNLAQVADEIDHRPRKPLDWTRPVDLLHDALNGALGGDRDRQGGGGA